MKINKIKFDNWRDFRGSDLDLAREVITNKDISIAKIAELTGLKESSLTNYRYYPDRLDGAHWDTINRLKQLNDMLYVKKHTDMESTLFFKDFFEQIIKEDEDAYGHEPDYKVNYQAFFEKLKQIILTDPVAVTELVKALNIDDR